MTFCRYCGEIVRNKDKQWEGQWAHTSCVTQRPYDLKIHRDNCTMLLHTELLSNYKLGRIIDYFERNNEEESNV